MKPVRFCVLISFAQLRSSAAVLERIPPEWELFLDSGAFTNHQAGREVCKLEDYIAFCKEHGDRFAHRFNLDKIGDPDTSRRNLNAMLDAGLEVVPVFQRGADFDELETLSDKHELIGIGGIANDLKSGAAQAYLREVMSRIRAHGAHAHLLGCGHDELSRYRPWSGDNSTWANAKRYGHFHVWHNFGWSTRLSKLWRDKGKPDYIKPDLKRTRLLSAYGLTWDDLATSEAWTQTGPVQILNIRSWMRFARHMRRHGCRYVMSITSGDVLSLRIAWELERESWGWGSPFTARTTHEGETPIVVGCVSKKSDSAAPARELYRSPLWTCRRRYAEASGRRWLILSGLHGLIEPDAVIEPYDQRINPKDAAFVEKVREQAVRMGLDSVEIIAGKDYVDVMKRAGVTVTAPMEGLGLFKRMAWLKEHTA